MSEAFCMPLLPMELECLLYCTWLHNCSLDPLLVCSYILACWLLVSVALIIFLSLYIYSTAVHLIIPFCVHFMSLIKCGMLCHLSSMNICWGLFTTMMDSAVHGFGNYVPWYFLYGRHWRFLSLSFTNSSGGQNVLFIADKLLSCLFFAPGFTIHQFHLN